MRTRHLGECSRCRRPACNQQARRCSIRQRSVDDVIGWRVIGRRTQQGQPWDSHHKFAACSCVVLCVIVDGRRSRLSPACVHSQQQHSQHAELRGRELGLQCGRRLKPGDVTGRDCTVCSDSPLMILHPSVPRHCSTFVVLCSFQCYDSSYPLCNNFFLTVKIGRPWFRC
jgi:hypothetical protein